MPSLGVTKHAFARRDKGKNARGDGNSDWDRGKSTKKERKKLGNQKNTCVHITKKGIISV